MPMEGLMMNLLEEIKTCVIKGHINSNSNYPADLAGQPGVEELVTQAISEKIEVSEILHQSLIGGMEVVGNKFSNGEYFVPEMLFSAKSMKSGLNILRPYLVDEEISTIGTVIIGTVEGDMHDIGKNLVAMMLEGAGFEIIDLGVNTTTQKFIDSAKDHPHALVGLSALLTVTMEKMRDVIGDLEANGLDNKILIGGAPVTESYAEEIGAHGYAKDASHAVRKAKELLNIA
jgi:5-methyltetrahydrofolate--homocysteine methyltransferase